jgi:hypothetical protein
MLSSYLILLIKSSSSLFEIFQNKKTRTLFLNFAKFSKKKIQIYTKDTFFQNFSNVFIFKKITDLKEHLVPVGLWKIGKEVL